MEELIKDLQSGKRICFFWEGRCFNSKWYSPTLEEKMDLYTKNST